MAAGRRLAQVCDRCSDKTAAGSPAASGGCDPAPDTQYRRAMPRTAPSPSGDIVPDRTPWLSVSAGPLPPMRLDRMDRPWRLAALLAGSLGGRDAGLGRNGRWRSCWPSGCDASAGVYPTSSTASWIQDERNRMRPMRASASLPGVNFMDEPRASVLRPARGFAQIVALPACRSWRLNRI